MNKILFIIIVFCAFYSKAQIQISNDPKPSSSSSQPTRSYVDIYWTGTDPIKILLDNESQFFRGMEKKRFYINHENGYKLSLQTATQTFNYELFLMFDRGSNILVVNLENGVINVSENLDDFQANESSIKQDEHQILESSMPIISSESSESTGSDTPLFTSGSANQTIITRSEQTERKRQALKNEFVALIPVNPTERTHQITKHKNGNIQMVFPKMDNEYKINGTYVMYLENGKLSAVGAFSNNTINGRLAIFNENEELISIQVYESNKLMEVEIAWDEQANELHYPNFKNGNGSLEYYHDNGFLFMRFEYKNGVLDGKCITYHKNGQLKSDITYKAGLPYSVNASYNEDGSYFDLGTLKNGNGSYKMYDENGKLLLTQNYKNGSPVY